MSTIKSSDEHLTLNADGSSKDIKFQANGVEKASISSAGAFTSTTIDATKLTGNLPALNASALTNLDAADVSGTHTNFTSTGIDDNATSTAITIDASENVGIGAAPESGTSGDVLELDIGLMSLSIWKGESQPNDSASYGYNCYKTSGFTYKAKKSSTGGDWKPAVYEQAYGQHKFRVATSGATADAAISFTDAMVIDNSGRVGIGTLSPQSSSIISTQGASDGLHHHYFFNAAGTGVGRITCTSSTTSYVTSSDYRLKENVDYDWDATTRLKQLKPARFNFIADDTNTLVDGFIAHEVSSVVPEAVTGQKDAMIPEVLYAEGDDIPEGKSVGDVKTAAAIDPQGIDQSKLVPLLVKTIQELEARITALEA